MFSRVLSQFRGQSPIAVIRKNAAGVSVLAVSGALAAAVLTTDGYHTRDVDLDDAGVWVVKRDAAEVGRANLQAKVIDLATKPGPTRQVWQSGTDVLVLSDDGRLRTVDPVVGQISETSLFVPEAQVSANGGTVAVLEPSGALHVWPLRGLPAGNVADDKEAAVQVGAGSAVAVDVDGVTHVVDKDGRISTFDVGPVKRSESKLDSTLGSPAITTVGSTAVVLDRASGALYASGHDGEIGQVGAGDPADSGAQLQQPGPARGAVLVQDGRVLQEVDLAGDGATVLSDSGQGGPVPPVFVNGCAYAAWGTEPAYAVKCPGRDVVEQQGVRNPVWHVNRGRAVLNDVVTGRNLAFLDQVVAIDDWTQALRPRKKDETEEAKRVVATADNAEKPKGGAQQPPRAIDDRAATRSGRPVVIPVLQNDLDPNGDPLAVADLVLSGNVGAEVAVVGGGESVQVTPQRGRTAPVFFDYVVSDGKRGGTDRGRVQVDVRADSVNTAPKALLKETLVVEAGQRIVFDLLRNVKDPEGDPVSLTSVALKAQLGSAQYTPAGLLILEAGNQVGTQDVTFTFSDDRGASAEAPFRLVIRKKGDDLAPKANDDFVQVLRGVDGYIDLLANDSDGNNDPLTLTRVQNVQGLTVQQLGGGLVRVRATEARSFQVDYEVTDGVGVSKGRLRVDAADELKGDRVIAVRDDAVITPGLVTTLKPLDNDISNAGTVLVLQEVSSDDPNLSVDVVDHESLRISSRLPLTKPVEIAYTVSDGSASDAGLVLVRPGPAQATDQAPVTDPDVATVRAGNATPIPVLANDFDPEGGALTLTDVSALAAGQGIAFTQGEGLRYLAPADFKGSVRLTYTARDVAGNTSSGRVLIRVTPAAGTDNKAPLPAPVVARVFLGKKVTVALPLLGADPDGDPVTYTLNRPVLSQVGLGTFTNQRSDSFDYTAGSDPGTEVLQYVVRDSLGLEATGTVSIGIVSAPAENQAPLAADDEGFVRPGGRTTLSVLENDTDPDGDTLKLVEVTPPSSGTAAISGRSVAITVPATAKAKDVVSFGYVVTDQRGARSRASVAVEVVEQVRPRTPVLRDDLVEEQRTGVAVRVPVLDNDDLQGAAVRDLQVDTVGLPGARWDGKDVVLTMPARPVAFAYAVTRRGAPTVSALVVVPWVRPDRPSPPAPRPDNATTKTDTAVTLEVLSNDRDPNGLPLSITEVPASVNGKAVAVGRAVRFAPSKGFAGVGTFTYRVSNGKASAVGTATVRVVGASGATSVSNKAPVVTTLSITLPAGGTDVLDLALAARDADGDRLSFGGLTGARGDITASLSGSRLTLSASKTAKGQSVSLSYTVNDGKPKGSARGLVSVAIEPFDQPLVQTVADTAGDSLGGEPVSADVLANDVAVPDVKPLKVVNAIATRGGTASHDGRVVTFTPTAGFFGAASVTYTVADATGEVSRQVQGVMSANVVQRPGPPGVPSGIASSTQVDLSWAAAEANGAPVTTYTVRWSGGGKTGQLSCPTNACRVTGLENGPDYTFTVTATNVAGEGTASQTSAAIKVDEVPPPPSAPTVESGDGFVTLTWTNNSGRGSSITSTEVVIAPGGQRQVVPGTSTSYRWENLTNGSAYSFYLVAVNSAGKSEDGDASAQVTPAGKPKAPFAPRAGTTPNAGTVVVDWSAADSNGADITGYTVTVYKNGAVDKTIAHNDTTNLQETVQSQTKAQYSFDVTATNRVGTSERSPQSNVVTPTSRPEAVGGVSAVAGDTRAPLTFSDPDDNGKAISTYKVKINGGTEQALPADKVVTGLSNGTAYTFQVSACNADGCGSFSGASNTVTPFGVPGVANVSASKVQNTIFWRWIPAPDNGSPVSSYELYLDGTNVGSVQGTEWSRDFGGCGQSHSLYVRAVNARGTGAPSNTVTESTEACPPPPTMSISKGTPKTVEGCESTACHRVRVELANFPGGGAQVRCTGSPGGRFVYDGSDFYNAPNGTSEYWVYGFSPGSVTCTATSGGTSVSASTGW